MSTTTGGGRKRSNSVKETLNALEPTRTDHRISPSSTSSVSTSSKRNKVAKLPWEATGRLSWLVSPLKTFQLISLTVVAWYSLEHFTTQYSGPSNPLSRLLFISHRLAPQLGETETKYGKGYYDLTFLGFYIIVFSFLRQSITEFMIRPLAKKLGLKTESKQARFMEQAYAVVYFSCSGAFGLYVMSKQPTWWYKTEHMWLEYPHWRMSGLLKSYYLLQFSYWCQQMIILVLGLEKPRSDFKELVIHHIVTLWLVGWSYLINLTMIGTMIFVSMDLPDICLAFSKCLNYLDLQHTSEVSFVFFLVVWHYMRHYLNLLILWSVWTQFDLIPAIWRSYNSETRGWWLVGGLWKGTGEIPPWMKYQIFAPILALQLVNSFWSYLIWRILFRMLSGNAAKDVREEGEDEEEAAKEIEDKKKR
ncbi:uncharacterized protein JCM6883_004622 [Sporobolomyces salmoneus]|uniref:uncharacterized protein n=1 Tax=Sporobolomyces salmoneus TaxID=183962 RepID=UPI0031806333